MASSILGAAALKSRLQSFEREMAVQASSLIEDQAAETQRDLAMMIPAVSGQARAAVADPAAIAVRKDRAGNVVSARVGLTTAELRKSAFYLLFLEKGRKRYVAGDARLGVRFAGIDKRRKARGKDGRMFRRVKRNVGPIAARQYFRIAYTLLAGRMASARGLNRLKAFVLDNAKPVRR